MERESRRQRTLSIVLNQVAEIFQKVLFRGDSFQMQYNCYTYVL